MNDLIVIGGGPAGLSAALNGAAEGLSVRLLERDDRLGGQAGTSSLIENYLGFGAGVSGGTLVKHFLLHTNKDKLLSFLFPFRVCRGVKTP